MKHGSIFDGIGGFPLSAAMCGIEPVWASEIEPFPILTTYRRFPGMTHLGSVTDIHGDEVEPVDIVTFGSPCQDLSVAGKQAGIHNGERSNLFFEAVRIIKEMRDSDRAKGAPAELCRPRFAVWENVPGAFSSNKGQDFQAVLQALAEVAEPDVSVPMPAKNKWEKAGCVVGDGWSIAWRVYDAQYWGVPQRRKRIYLVADFGSERAGEILFEPEGVRGDSSQGGTPWQRAASDAEGSPDGGCAAGFVGRQGDGAGSVGFEMEKAPTLRSAVTSDVVALDCRNLNGTAELSGTLQAKATGGHSLNYQNPVAYRNALSLTPRQQSLATASELAGTLAASDYKEPRAVIYDTRGNGNGETAPTLTEDHQNRVTDYTGITVHGFDMQAFGKYSDCGTSSTLKQRDYKDATDLVVENRRRYIVRRLTPLECCRLQGYPDGWTENLAIPCAYDVIRRLANQLAKGANT